MSYIDEIFNDGYGLKDLKEFERAKKDLQKLKKIGTLGNIKYSSKKDEK